MPEEIPDPFTLTRSRPSLSPHSLRTARTWDANASFSSMRSIWSMSRPARSSARLVEGDGPDAHRLRSDPGDRPGDEPAERPQAELLRAVAVGDDAGGRAVVLAAGVAGRDRRFGVLAQHHRPQTGQRLDARVGARMLIDVDHAIAHRYRHDLLRKSALAMGSHGELVGAQRELILRGPLDRIVAADVLRRLEHPAPHGVPGSAGGDPRASETILQARAAPAYSPAQLGRVELDLAHALDAPGDDQLGGPRLHLQACVDHGLQRRAAAAIDLHTRNLHPQSCVERGHPADRRSLSVR